MARGAASARPRHVPQRTCVACREGKAKRELIRIVRLADGSVRIDPSGKASGRGAYLCQREQCWSDGLKRGVLPRALKIDALPSADADALASFAAGLPAAAATDEPTVAS